MNVHGGLPHEDETEALDDSTDPALLVAERADCHDHHPLFPRADGSAETRDIQFVTFCRRRTSDQAMQNCPEDIPARDVTRWAQVVAWWGGGEYKAIAKDANHRMVAWFPSVNGEWLSFDGDSKPFLLRNGKGYSTSGAAVAPPSVRAPPAAPTPAPAPQDALLGMMTLVLHELRTPRVAMPPPSTDAALVAMIQAHAAQATATTQAHTQIMQTLLWIVAPRPVESRRVRSSWRGRRFRPTP